MHCVVTAGPTAEPLDEVRRLTNESTGRLGAGLSQFLAAKGCRVTLLWSRMSVVPKPREVDCIREFTTTAELGLALEAVAGEGAEAVFHVAAVSDFTFGRVYERTASGSLIERQQQKIESEGGDLVVELKPTPKLIAGLVTWFPKALCVGWKYEMNGDRPQAIQSALAQIQRNKTHGCVVNGAAYGPGYGLVTADGACRHLETAAALYEGLWELLKSRTKMGD
jgi:phosphopantothenoylcysteine decarboxylase/phosphopantothenate--cysteine ligase